MLWRSGRRYDILIKKLKEARHGGEGTGDRAGGPRGRGKNHAVGIHAVFVRGGASAGTGGSRGRLSGHRQAGKGAGHHHFFQAGHAAMEQNPPDHFRHSRPHGFFRRNGAGAGGAGRVRAAAQRPGRGAGPHPHAVEIAGGLWGAGVFLRQQDGRLGRPTGGYDPARRGKPGGRGGGYGRPGRHGKNRPAGRGEPGLLFEGGPHPSLQDTAFDPSAAAVPGVFRLRPAQRRG